jgi:hypothetical protein
VQFAQLGLTTAQQVAQFLINVVATQTPVAEEAEGAIDFLANVGGADRIIRIVIGSNGFMVTAFPR